MRDYSSRNGSFATFVAAEADEKLCGFVEASLRSSAQGCTSRPVAYLEGIFVWPDFRRRGVARHLVAAVEHWAASHGCVEFASDCHTDNEPSVHFHRRLGFEVAEQVIHFRRALCDDSGNA
jgi:aminoglycoside 6'-N-acetyltransferase I